ncbi:MAG: branched-chain amino acid transport system ATP-binding protein [Solirubrobacteraceae bacterium]|jgi:ABC-type branched-subunit amino acid transport system ATPase component|nr:branched-chain amino acid transport system ATP-binding protein [Solirubrobacteraceae bacterium]
MHLTTDRLTKTFSGVHALSEVDLRVERGEILGVIGPNGSGKTTLINCISGVLSPSAGRVLLEGDAISGRRSYRVARAGIARTFQNVRLFADMTALENAMVPASSVRRGGALKMAREALERLGLSQFESSPVSEVPFPLQRRLEIARAVCLHPKFLLLDEPAAGLNETESDELLRTLVDIRDWLECGILLVDHDLRLIMRGTQRIHVLAEGRTLAEGTPDQIRRDQRVINAYLGTETADAAPAQTEKGRTP